jgi:hypothetical protein
MNNKTILSVVLILILSHSLTLNAQTRKKVQSNFKQTPQTKKEVGGQKFCFDDTYGSTRMKLQITLFDDKTAKLDFLQGGDVKRSGVGEWVEGNRLEQGFYGEGSLIYLYLSTGKLQFSAWKNSFGRTYLLLDTRNNQYLECNN